MRHRVKRTHLNRDHDHKKALQKNLVKSFVQYGFIKTTKPKAVFLRTRVERLVKWAKIGDLTSRRRLLAYIPDKKLVSKFIEDAQVFKGRNGGYTRMVNLGKRLGDKASMVKMEWSEQSKKKEDVKKEDIKTPVEKTENKKETVKKIKEIKKVKKEITKK
ncbi:MAG: 50S ribosomal protein L17 [bacterium]